MGESPSQYTVKRLGTEYVPAVNSTGSTVLGSVFPVSTSQHTVQALGIEHVPVVSNVNSIVVGNAFTVSNYATKVVRVPIPAYSIIQRDNYYDTVVSIDLN